MFRDITFTTTKNRANGFTIALFVVGDEILPVPILFIRDNLRKLINLEFLILWRMGIVKCPLLERNISTDKVKKPVDLFLLVLNELK